MTAEFLKSATRPEEFPAPSLPEFAFLGRSNVGKSTLLNTLVGRKGLAFTSSRPGRTQMVNFFRVDGRCHLVDLPGYGYARAPKDLVGSWKDLVEGYLTGRETLALSFLLLDARRGWMEKDLALREWLQFHGRQFIVVATKFDKYKNQSEKTHGMTAIRREAGESEVVPFSAVTGQGVREIWQAIWKSKIRM